MRSVFRQYGMTIIVVLVAVICLLTIGFVFQYEYRIVHNVGKMEQVPAQAMEHYQHGRNLSIQKDERTILTGEKIRIDQYFKVTNSIGQIGITKVKSIKNSGVEMLDKCLIQEAAGQFFCFNEPGIYTLLLEISDRNWEKQYMELTMPVRRGIA